MAARRRKLLLADDSPTIRKVVQLTFSDEGVEVTAVGTGAEALAEIERSRPDVVLADVHMPGVGGYELCERIKRDESLARIPVVLLVGAFEPFSEAEARRVGADEVLTKPFQSIRDLVGKVGSLFGGKPADETRADEAPAAAPRADARDATAATTDARTEARAASPASAAVRDEPRAAAPPEPFADMDFDDRMIEAQPAEMFGRTGAATVAAEADDSHEAFQETTRTEMTTQDEGRTDAPAAASPFARAFDAPRAGFDAAGRGAEVGAAAPEVRASAATAETSAARVETGAARVETGAAEVGMAAGAGASEPVFATRFTSPAAADDALLDLGRIEPPPSADESDDFVLDLDEDLAPSSSAQTAAREERAAAPFTFDVDEEPFTTRDESSAMRDEAGAMRQESVETRADAAGAFAEAAHGAGADEVSSWFQPAPSFDAAPSFDEQAQSDSTAAAYDELAAEVSRDAEVGEVSESSPRDFIEPHVVPSEEPEHPAGAHAIADLSVEGDIARPPFDTHADSAAAPEQPSDSIAAPLAASVAAPARSDESTAATPARLDAAQLPPEVIEQIARRAVELLSEREVREIAWEVVPELAERLIKQRLDEIAQK